MYTGIVHICLVPRGFGSPLVLELRMAVSHHVCAGNRICVLCKSCKCSSSRNYLSSLNCVIEVQTQLYTKFEVSLLYILGPVFKKQNMEVILPHIGQRSVSQA